jgi:hypothetical protein
MGHQSVFQNWKSLFARIKDYLRHPEKYIVKPCIPAYGRAKKRNPVHESGLHHNRGEVSQFPENQAATKHRQAGAHQKEVETCTCYSKVWAISRRIEKRR